MFIRHAFYIVFYIKCLVNTGNIDICPGLGRGGGSVPLKCECINLLLGPVTNTQQDTLYDVDSSFIYTRHHAPQNWNLTFYMGNGFVQMSNGNHRSLV